MKKNRCFVEDLCSTSYFVIGTARECVERAVAFDRKYDLHNRAWDGIKWSGNKAALLARKAKGTFTERAAALGVGIGGMDFGLHAADLDIVHLGIGMHCHWFYHSAITSTIVSRLTAHYIKKWRAELGDEAAGKERLLRLLAVFLAMANVGLAVHLFADMFGTKAVVGAPLTWMFAGGDFVDNLWLGANAFYALKLARDLVLLAKGEDVDVGSLDFLIQKIKGRKVIKTAEQ